MSLILLNIDNDVNDGQNDLRDVFPQICRGNDLTPLHRSADLVSLSLARNGLDSGMQSNYFT